MDVLRYLQDTYNLDLNSRSPIEIPNVCRETLGDWFRIFGYKVGAEIGVERGIFSSILLKANPGLKLFCIDPWEAYDGYVANIDGSDLPVKFYEAMDRLSGYNVEIVKKYSMDAVLDFEDESLDFVYIDGNHNLPWVMDDIIQWEKKIRPGGIVSGHDYIRGIKGRKTIIKVIEALSWYTTLKPIPTWFVLGRHDKIAGELRDNSRSWFWVKQ